MAGKTLELITHCRTRNVQPALDCLDNNECDVNHKDEHGCTALHYAASNGQEDIIVKLAEKKANFNLKNKAGDTAIYNAVEHDMFDSLVALVAFGGDVNITDKKQRHPLKLAIDMKKRNTAEFLCSVGATLDLVECGFDMLVENMEMLNENDKNLMMLIANVGQYQALLALKNGFHRFEIVCLEPKKDIVDILQKFGVTLVGSPNITNRMYLYCSQMTPEYNDITERLEEDQYIFSDIYEFNCWRCQKFPLNIILTVPGVVGSNTVLRVRTLHGAATGQMKAGGVDVVEGHTKFDIRLDLSKGPAAFLIIAEEKVEVFKVSTKGSMIKPEIEPGSCIKVPPGCFHKDVELSVRFSDTTYWTADENDPDSKLLFTNIISVNTSDNIQPESAVSIRLPMKHLPVVESAIVILAASEETLDAAVKWEELNDPIIDGQFVVFDVHHFSWYVAGCISSRKLAQKHAEMALERERCYHFSVALKKETDTEYKLVLHYSLQRLGKKRRKVWKGKGFKPQLPEYKSCNVQCERTYKISFSDTLGVMDYHDSETEIIIQSQKKHGYRWFLIKRGNQMTEPTGTVTIGKQVVLRPEAATSEGSETRQSFVGRVWEKFIRNFKGNKADFPRRGKFTYQEILSLPVGAKELPPVQRVNEIVNKRKTLKYLYVEVEDADPNDPECTINVLRLSSLEKVGCLLTDDECYELGLKLRLNSRNPDKSSERFKIDMFKQWRGNRPHNALVTTLISALESIDKVIIGEIVQEAFDRKTEFNYIYE